MFEIAIAGVVQAVVGPGDDPDVAFALGRDRLGLRLCEFGQVLVRGPAQERDGFAVGRPGRRGRSLREVGHGPGLAPFERQEIDMRRFRLALPFRPAEKQ